MTSRQNRLMLVHFPRGVLWSSKTSALSILSWVAGAAPSKPRCAYSVPNDGDLVDLIPAIAVEKKNAGAPAGRQPGGAVRFRVSGLQIAHPRFERTGHAPSIFRSD